MGCDIHMFIEHKHKDDNYWRPFGGRIHGRRNYTLFGYLANVRGDGAIIEPRGLPEELGYEADALAYYYITDTKSEGEQCTTLQTARNWEKNYGCKIITNSDGEPKYVQHPDWHTYSWLTTKEFRAVLKKYNKQIPKEYAEYEYEAILSAMAKLEKFNLDVRLVFWFDN
jgi:hypothetical protein